VVMGLVEGGSAKAAGLLPDDVITEVDAQPVQDPGQLVARLGAHHAGDRVKIRWIRAGRAEEREVVMRPRPFESSPGTRVAYGAVAVDGALRRTIVVGPADEAPHPAVLYITGIGCFSQESLGIQSTEAKLLHGLARAGFVTMRVEKSAVGDSQGPACHSPQSDLEAEVAGYVEGLKALKELPQVDAKRVFVVGLSIGGVEAPLIARRIPVQGIVVINTVAKPFIEYLLETRRRQGRLKGETYDEVDERVRLTETCNHALLVERKAPEAIVAAQPACKDSIQYPAPHTYMQQWAALNLPAEWKAVTVPVLIVQGESDYVATVSDAPLLRDILESYHPGLATLAIIPSMDHFLTQAATMKASQDNTTATAGPFATQALDTIRDWLVKRAAG
jgi:pimeloyl-ACP methyl ester carboxylesterase